MSFWGALGKGLLGAIPVVGPALSAASQAQAQNRGNEFAGQLDLQRLLMERDQQFFNNTLAREQEGREGSSDAFRKLLATGRLMNPGARPQLSPYSVAPRQASGAELSGADALQQQVLARLQGGNPIAAPQMQPLNVDPKLLKPGALERILGIASPAASIFSAARAKRA